MLEDWNWVPVVIFAVIIAVLVGLCWKGGRRH